MEDHVWEESPGANGAGRRHWSTVKKLAVGISSFMVAVGTGAGMLAIVGGSATAAPATPPELVACLGAAQSNGSFVPQQVSTGPIPKVGLDATENLCAVIQPNAVSDTLNTALGRLTGISVPTSPPSPAAIQQLVSELQSINPSSPFAALTLVSDACRAFGATSACNAVIGTAVGAALGGLPLGNLTLNGTGGSCYSGVQSGTGSLSTFGPGEGLNLAWQADYAQGANAVGILSGTATPPSYTGDTNTYTISGGIGLGCGAGAKGVVMFIS